MSVACCHAVEIGVIAQRRSAIAGVVRRDDDEALGREHGRRQARLGVVGDIGHVVGLLQRGAVRVQQHRARIAAGAPPPEGTKMAALASVASPAPPTVL
jgi:hypothetical protein